MSLESCLLVAALALGALCATVFALSSWWEKGHPGEEVPAWLKPVLWCNVIFATALAAVASAFLLRSKDLQKAASLDKEVPDIPQPTHLAEAERDQAEAEKTAEDQADLVRNAMTDDEVAERGASLFDPGEDGGEG